MMRDPDDALDRREDQAAQRADAYHRWLAALPPLPDRSEMFPVKERAA